MDLVLQGPTVTASAVAPFASLTGAQGIHVLEGGAPAYRLTRVERQEGVAERCAAAAIDFAFVPPDLTRDRATPPIASAVRRTALTRCHLPTIRRSSGSLNGSSEANRCQFTDRMR